MKRKKAFTIIETLIALVVLGLIAITITMINPLKKNYNQKNVHAADFQSFLNNIEAKKKHYILFEKAGQHFVTIISREYGKRYDLHLYNKVVVLSGVNGGYYPLLDDVRSIDFKEVKKHLAIKVVFNNNESYEDVSSISYE